MAATTYDDIYAIAAPEDFVVVKGKRIRVGKLHIRALAVMARRFPGVDFLQDVLSSLGAATKKTVAPSAESQADGEPVEAAEEDQDAAIEAMLDQVDVLYALAAAAIGKPNDETAERYIEEVFSLQEVTDIVTKCMRLTAGGVDEGFSSPSA